MDRLKVEAINNVVRADIERLDNEERRLARRADMARRIMYGLSHPNSEEAWVLQTKEAREYMQSLGFSITPPVRGATGGK